MLHSAYPTQNLLMMFDYIRVVNLFDGQVSNPFVPNTSTGQVTGLRMLDAIYKSMMDLVSMKIGSWNQRLNQKALGGTMLCLGSIGALSNRKVLVSDWENGRPQFGHSSGAGRDVRVIKEVVSNNIPKYMNWKGRDFGPEDKGKTFKFIEIGLLPEVFCVGQANHPNEPRLSKRLLTGGKGYKRGLDEFSGLRVNGIPLQLWGNSGEDQSKKARPVT